MSIEASNPSNPDEGLEALKSPAKVVKKPVLDILGKFKQDLDYLVNGKMSIEKRMVEEGIDDEEINKKLERLKKSIKEMERLIAEYEAKHQDDENED